MLKGVRSNGFGNAFSLPGESGIVGIKKDKPIYL